MKYANAILLSIAAGVWLDILIDLLIPDHVMNVAFVVMMSVLLLGILLVAFGTAGYQSRDCELPRVRFADAESAATGIIEASPLG